MKIVAVGSPKGGVGKTTTAVTLAAIASKAGLNVHLVDADPNRSALDWTEESDDAVLDIEVSAADKPEQLRRLRKITGHDVLIVDLPGAKAGEFDAILRGDDDRPVADLLVAPTVPEHLDMLPVLRVLRGEVIPMGLQHLMVFTKVPTSSIPRAEARRAELRAAGMTIANSLIRRYSVFDEAVERSCTVLDVPGAHSYARMAETDYRALADEVFTAVDLTITTEAHRG